MSKAILRQPFAYDCMKYAYAPFFIKYEPAYVDLEFRRELAERIEVTVMSV